LAKRVREIIDIRMTRRTKRRDRRGRVTEILQGSPQGIRRMRGTEGRDRRGRGTERLEGPEGREARERPGGSEE